MDRLPRDPTNFRELVEADLRRAARLIIEVQDEIDPQFRIATPEGDYWVAVTLPDDVSQRMVMLRWVGRFMGWKKAVGFTLASELREPDCVYCAGVTAGERAACMVMVARQPRPWTARNFGPVQWLPPASIGKELWSLLPRGRQRFEAADVALLQEWFGPDGRFPAVHIASGELRGV